VKADEKETFLARWSRLKREQPPARIETEGKTETPAPVLPPVDKLTPESEFSGFMHPKVKDELRRLALKKLFSDPHFNIPDPFEAYSGDFTVGEPIPPELLAQLNQARTVLFMPQEENREKKQDEEPAQAHAQGDAPTQEGESKQDEPRRQDT